jgi:AraC family transcriptional activator of mtrCDE
MNVLSDILRVLKLKSSIYFRTRLTAPWGIAVPEQQGVARFHVLLPGRCWIGIPDGGEPQELNSGDLFIVPHGSAHTLRCEKTTPAQSLSDVMEMSEFDGETLVYGGSGRETNLVCGHFAFDQDIIHPMLASLPSRVHLRATEKTGFAWLDSALAFILDEASGDQLGAPAVIDRLSEILFIQILRTFMAQG